MIASNDTSDWLLSLDSQEYEYRTKAVQRCAVQGNENMDYFRDYSVLKFCPGLIPPFLPEI